MPLMSIFDGPFCKKNIFALCFQACCCLLGCGVFFHLEFQKWKNLIMMIYCMLVRVFGPARSALQSVPFIGLKKLDSGFFWTEKKMVKGRQLTISRRGVQVITVIWHLVQPLIYSSQSTCQVYDLSGAKKVLFSSIISPQRKITLRIVGLHFSS